MWLFNVPEDTADLFAKIYPFAKLCQVEESVIC